MKEITSIEALEFSIGGYFADYSYEVHLKGDTASFAKRQMPRGFEDDLTEIPLEAKRIKSLIGSLNRLGALDWEVDYSTGIDDGMQWHLEIEYNEGSSFRSGGDDYPGQSDPYSYNQTPEFAQLKRILVRLIQQPGFFR